jgi:hypothetical protein
MTLGFIFHNGNGSIKATAIYGLGEIECQKDTAELLALAFTPKLDSALKQIISYDRNENGQALSDGLLAIYKKDIQAADGKAEAISVDSVEQGSNFYTSLDRTCWLCDENTLALNVSIHYFIIWDLAFYATVVGKEGMNKAHRYWCRLPSAK